MILFGAEKTYASHLVYKSPHNYQVILELELPAEARAAYLSALAEHPGAQFILLLDSSDISGIQTAPFVSGVIQRVGADDERIEIAAGVRIERKDFRVILFDELPLSLEPAVHH
jgi:hypothetical protein